MTSFDCLNTELLLEVFDYLSFSDIFIAFFDLQQRINNAIRAYPLYIDLSKTTDRNTLKHGPFMCRALRAAGNDIEGKQIDYSCINFKAIRMIEFEYVNSTALQTYFKRLPMQQIEYITIISLCEYESSVDTNQQVWSKIAIAGQNQLRYLCVDLPIIRWNVEQLLFDLPSLKCAIFRNMSPEEMLSFMSHTPNLRSFTGRIIAWESYSNPYDFRLHRLIHLNLHIENCHSFRKLRQILSVCPYLTHFELQFWITGYNEKMVNAKKWQTLIEDCLSCLQYLTIRLFRFIRLRDDTNLEDTFDLSEYWSSRKPHFHIQYMEV